MMFRSNDATERPAIVLWVIAFILGAVGLVAIPGKADGGTLAKVKAYTVSCTTSARTLAESTTRPELTPGHALRITNGATQIFLGGSNVDATDNGYPLAASTEMSMDIKAGAVFCVTAAGSSTVEVLAGSF